MTTVVPSTPQRKYGKLGIWGAGPTIFRVALAASIRSSCCFPTAWEAADLGGGSNYHCQRKMQSRPTHREAPQGQSHPSSQRENRRCLGKANNQMGAHSRLCFATGFRIHIAQKGTQKLIQNK